MNVHSRARAQAMTEFALLLPVLLLLAFGIFEFGRAYYTYSAISNAARESARYGIITPTDTNGIINAGVTRAIGLGLNPSNFVVQCMDKDNNIGPIYCTSGKRIRVTVNYTFVSVAPLIPSFNMNAATTMIIE